MTETVKLTELTLERMRKPDYYYKYSDIRLVEPMTNTASKLDSVKKWQYITANFLLVAIFLFLPLLIVMWKKIFVSPPSLSNCRGLGSLRASLASDSFRLCKAQILSMLQFWHLYLVAAETDRSQQYLMHLISIPSPSYKKDNWFWIRTEQNVCTLLAFLNPRPYFLRWKNFLYRSSWDSFSPG